MPTLTQDNFTMPLAADPEDQRLAFLKNKISEGETFNNAQTGYKDIQKAKDIIAGVFSNKVSEQLSKINVNMEKRLIREIVGTMSNLRPLWGYSNDNPDLDKNTEELNKLLLSWYQTTFADRKIKKWCQIAAVMGNGYLGPTWSSTFWSRGRGDIDLKWYTPDNVIFDQLPADFDVQKAYMVTLKEEVPINLARAMFPTMAGKIIPDRTSPTGMQKATTKLTSFLSPVLNRFGMGNKNKQAQASVFPTVDIYQSYILDLTVNESQEPVLMGEPGTYWHYSVPGLNTDIPDGMGTDPATGEQVQKYRKATPEDAMLYPLRRLVTWCNSGILRDGPSYWWHGMVPAIKLAFDDWAWEANGFSMTRDLNTIEESSNTLRRAMDDSANARLRPALQYDDRTIAKGLMQSLDLRVPGQAIPIDSTISAKPIQTIVDSSFYDSPQWIPEMLNKNEELMKYLSGVNDFTAISKARQLPSSDTVEKILEMAGPLVTDISRNMEAALGQLGEMIKCLFFEFYTAPRRLQILGKDGITLQDYTEDEDGNKTPMIFTPGNLIPTHAVGEDPMNGPSRLTQMQRAKMFMNSFFFKITPNSLHNMMQMTRKLMYIQLQKSGQPIDPWTMAEVFDLPNFGHPPEGTKTMFERWVAWERIKGDLQARIQAQAQEILQAEQLRFMLKQAALQGGNPAGLQPPGPPETPPSQGGQPPTGAPGAPQPPSHLPQPSYSPALGNNPPGRPAEFAGNPHIAQKDQGTRSTITGS